MSRLPPPLAASAALLLGLAMAPALAVDWSLSGFGTLGYARSDRGYTDQRFIDDAGTWQRDSKLGAQLDLNLSPQWSMTGQAVFKPSERDDDNFELKPTWLFASWRPDNDVLFRLGKQRTPLYLNSENLEVGQTYDFVRLPIEMYALSPTQDLTGLYASRTWLREGGEFSAEALYGRTTFWSRSHLRDQGTRFDGVDSTVGSLVLNWRDERSRWRAGWHHARSHQANGDEAPVEYPFVPPGFYLLRGPGVPTTPTFRNDVFVLGAEVEVAPGWRLVAEAARNVQHDIHVAPGSAAGYVAVVHQIGPWSPYASLSRLVSLGAGAQTVNQLDAVALPGQDEINASQRAAADAYPTVYQTSLALGTSYALTASSKLKVEWLQTQVGRRSSLVDSPAGGPPIRDQGVRVWSLNYNFTF
jgi:opacity protein-like surface antigen